MRTLALDIGATKIAIGLLDQEHALQDRIQISSTLHSDIWGELKVLLQRFKADRVGIASAGPINLQAGTISPINIPQWRDFPIRSHIAELFPSASIGLLGDGTAVALAENKLGAGVGAENMLAVVVSTGVGGGLVINGKAFHGESGNAGLFGHHSIAFDSLLACDCGRIGCLESYARGPKMVEFAKFKGWNGGDDFKALAQSAREGDSLALEAIDRGAKALAVGITNVLNILDLHTVVLGGGVSFAGSIYWEPFVRHFEQERRYAGFLNEVHLYPAKLQADAGLIGASLFAEEISR